MKLKTTKRYWRHGTEKLKLFGHPDEMLCNLFTLLIACLRELEDCCLADHCCEQIAFHWGTGMCQVCTLHR